MMKLPQTIIAVAIAIVLSFDLEAKQTGDTISGTAQKKVKAFEFALRLDYMSVKGTTRYLSETSDVYIDFPEEGENNFVLSPTLSAGFETGRDHFFLGFNYVDLDFSGQTLEPTLLLFPDTSFVLIPPGTKVGSSIGMNILSLIWTRTVMEKKNHELGIGAGLMLIDYSSEYSIEGYFEEGGFRKLYPAPMLSIHYTLDVRKLEFTTLLGGVGVSINGNAIAYANMDFAVRYKLFRVNNWQGMISAGAKLVPFYLSYQSNELEFENKMNLFGPFLGFRIKKIR